MRRSVLLPLFLATPVLAGCGPADEPGAPATEPAAPAEATAGDEAEPVVADEPEKAPGKPSAIEVLGITPPDQPWSEMSFDEREFYMIGKVLPITKEVFREFDERSFSDFECETCHGEDAQERDFSMPAPSLPPVAEEGSEGWAAMERDHPRMVRFMKNEVTPTTATLLGLEGEFGCNDCHPKP